MSELDLVRIREAAMQYHIDHCEQGRCIVVHPETFLCSSISSPLSRAFRSHPHFGQDRELTWENLSRGMSRTQANRLALKLSGKRIPVLVVRDGELLGTVRLPSRKLTSDERRRFSLSLAKSCIEEDADAKSLSNRDGGSARGVRDFYSVDSYGSGRCTCYRHKVIDSDLAGPYREKVESIVSEGKLPIVLKFGKKFELVVVERPATS